jgi:voltage-gated sodium channel
MSNEQRLPQQGLQQVSWKAVNKNIHHANNKSMDIDHVAQKAGVGISADGGHGHRQQRPPDGGGPSNLFGDITDLSNPQYTCAEEKNLEDLLEQAKYNDTPFGHLAKNKKFELVTILIITLNAGVIGYDADYSAQHHKPENLYDPEAPIHLTVFENFFCTYFTFEILTRFLGFKEKHKIFLDFWFTFDFLLVGMMVLETWVLPFLGDSSPLGQLSILRLLRLLRITRMSKLIRAFPEILIIIKGIKAAVKAVSWVAFLLVMISFTWAIMLTNQYHQGHLSDDELEEGSIETLFGNMGKSMLHLIVMGTILDDVTYCCDIIRGAGDYHILALFIVYILINSFTLMNMLVGILVEVVGATSDGENKRLVEDSASDSIKTIFTEMDQDASGKITREEFLNVRTEEDDDEEAPLSPGPSPGVSNLPESEQPSSARRDMVRAALEDLDIKGEDFDKYMQLLFQGDEKEVSFDNLLNTILRLRPGTQMSALDFNAFKKRVDKSYENSEEWLQGVEDMCDQLFKGPADGKPNVNHIQQVQASTCTNNTGPLPGTLVETDGCPGGDGPHCGISPPTGSVPPRLQHITAPPNGTSPLPPQVRKNRITKAMLSRLEVTSSMTIVKELQRRHNVVDLEETGVPLSMMTEELQQRIEAMNCLDQRDLPKDHPLA